MTSFKISEKFCNAFQNGEYEIVLADKKFINSVSRDDLCRQINELCRENKYNIVILLSKATNNVRLSMFTVKHVYYMIEHEDIKLVKAFVKRFPDIFRNTDYKNVSWKLCEFHDIEIVKFILERPRKKFIADKIISEFIFFSLSKNHIDILEYLISKYHDDVKKMIGQEINRLHGCNIHLQIIDLVVKIYPEIDCFDLTFYFKLVRTNNIVMLRYMFDNFDHDVFFYLYTCEMNIETMKLVFDASLDKNYKLSHDASRIYFYRACHEGDFDTCYKLKYHYPEFDTSNLIYNGDNEKLSNWLKDGCPVTRMMKSSRKVV